MSSFSLSLFYFLINLFEEYLHENDCSCLLRLQMSLPGKKGRDASQLPTLSYEIKLNLPVNIDSNPQEISFLDLVANDSKFVRIPLFIISSIYFVSFLRQMTKKV